MRERKLDLAIVVILGILSLLSALGVVTVVFNSALAGLYKVEAIFDLLALILAFVYIVNGYSKDYAKYYKFAMLFDAFNALIVTAVSANEKSQYISIISCAICFGLILILALGKNLGKVRSLTFCIIVVVLRTMGLVNAYFEAKTLDPKTLLVLSQLVLALFILTATLAKYDDKQVRGAK